MKKKILIVGGAGFIGHNLAIKLKKKKFKVAIVDGLEVNNLTSIISNSDNLPNPRLSREVIDSRLELINKYKIPFFVQDARDYHKLSKTISIFKPDILVHLAAISHSNRSNKNPYSTFDHSLRTLENSLDACKNKIKHFIFLSSSMVYGNFKSNEVTLKNIL